MRRKLLLVFVAATALLMAVEAFARFYLGLGDPPLTVRDSEIEYMFAPSRTYERFGNRVAYNAYSMRSDDFPREKISAAELRILVLGDSVVNGGSLTDQDDLATTILQRRLRREYGITAVVGNVSAGSWGPANLLAYIKRFGWFDADIVFIVLSSHDLVDVPSFPNELGPDFPQAPPILALEEAILRYMSRYLPMLPSIRRATARGEAQPEDRVAGARYLRDLLSEAKQAVPRVMLLLHPDPEELRAGFSSHGEQILKTASDAGVRTLSASVWMTGRRTAYHRDSIHLSERGQRLYAELFLREVLALLNTPFNESEPVDRSAGSGGLRACGGAGGGKTRGRKRHSAQRPCGAGRASLPGLPMNVLPDPAVRIHPRRMRKNCSLEGTANAAWKVQPIMSPHRFPVRATEAARRLVSGWDSLSKRLLTQVGVLLTGDVASSFLGLSFVERFGWFDADLAFIVVSSHDLSDVPRFPDELGPGLIGLPTMSGTAAQPMIDAATSHAARTTARMAPSTLSLPAGPTVVEPDPLPVPQ